MSKKYTIKIPSKCQKCDKKDNCEFVKTILKKPFDITGILINCKAFYSVFCELEKRCRVPFHNPEEMEKYRKKTDEDKEAFLTPAMVTNGILSAELALKALVFLENGTFECTHKINKLLESLPEVHKDALTRLLKEKTHNNDQTLKYNLDVISNFFVDWRYSFQHETIGYSNFLPGFIHIVYDYVFDVYKGN